MATDIFRHEFKEGEFLKKMNVLEASNEFSMSLGKRIPRTLGLHIKFRKYRHCNLTLVLRATSMQPLQANCNGISGVGPSVGINMRTQRVRYHPRHHHG
jgi:hypothetical protein